MVKLQQVDQWPRAAGSVDCIVRVFVPKIFDQPSGVFSGGSSNVCRGPMSLHHLRDLGACCNFYQRALTPKPKEFSAISAVKMPFLNTLN